MRAPFLSCLAAAAAVSACLQAHAAEWTQLPAPASTGIVVYTDLASERSRHGRVVGFFLPNPRRAWFLTDYTTPHRWKMFQIGSSKELIEFDCRNSSLRVLIRLYYAGPMAQGRLLAQEAPSPGFTLVIPGDVEESMHASACRPPVEETNATVQALQAAPARAGVGTAAPPSTAPAALVAEPEAPPAAPVRAP